MASPPFPGLRAVLFDLDGTLIHTRIDFGRMKAELLALTATAGIDAAPLRELDALALIEAAAPQTGDAEEFRARAEKLLIDVELAGCEGAVEAPGAAATLTWLLAQGLRVGIITRNSPVAVAHLLREFPLPHEVLLTRADTPRVKPDPAHLWLALERLEVPPEASLMVGDHRMDVHGGHAAGTRTLGILTPDKADDYFAECAPDGVLRSLPELRAWISP